MELCTNYSRTKPSPHTHQSFGTLAGGVSRAKLRNMLGNIKIELLSTFTSYLNILQNKFENIVEGFYYLICKKRYAIHE